MPLDLSDDERAQLAADLAAELEPGRYGNQFLLSRRQLLSLAGGSAGVAGLVALGVDPATAQSAAGQVGTSSEPVDVFAYDLDVQGALQRDLDAGGQAITNVGSLSTDGLDIGSSDAIDSGDFLNWGPTWFVETGFSTTSTNYVNTSINQFIDYSEHLPTNADAAFIAYYGLVGSPGDIRLQNRTDGETVFEESNIDGNSFTTTGTYTPTTTNGRVTLTIQVRTNDSGDATDIDDRTAVSIGVQV